MQRKADDRVLVQVPSAHFTGDLTQAMIFATLFEEALSDSLLNVRLSNPFVPEAKLNSRTFLVLHSFRT